MDCRELRNVLGTYLDGEFAEEERVLCAAHLQSCAACRSLVRFETHLRERLHQLGTNTVAPPELRARVAGALQRAGRQRRRMRWAMWSALPAMAAAAAAVLLLVPRAPDVSAVAEQSVQWHRAYPPLDVRASNVEAVRRFLTDKVPFAVRPPHFREANAKLEGARLSELAGHRAAYLRYRVGDERVSVFIVDPSTLPQLPPSAGRHKHRVFWRGVRGYNVAVYAADGMGYTVTSEMDRGNLVRLIGDVQ